VRNLPKFNLGNKPKIKKPNVAFGPIPVRAAMDMRLANWHWRVLTVICHYDRFGYNGQGCNVGRKRIAEASATRETHVSGAVSDLERWGYIRVARDEVDERKKTYHVIYLDEDWNLHGAALKNRSPIVDLSEQNRSIETADRSTEPPRKVHGESVKSLTDKEDQPSNIEDIKIKEGSVSEVVGTYCAEARQSRKSNWTTELAERHLSEVQSLPLDQWKWERSVLTQIAEDVGLPDSVRELAAKLRDAT
jgi:DNA-binding MarR family transcriptional regulator